MIPNKKSENKKRKVEMMEVETNERPGKKMKNEEPPTNLSSPLLPTADCAALFEQAYSASSLPAMTENILTPSEFADEFECAICQEMYLVRNSFLQLITRNLIRCNVVILFAKDVLTIGAKRKSLVLNAARYPTNSIIYI
jgi:hypothetical protein